MSTPRTRLVRRTPLVDRIIARLNPWDFLLWLSEEINGNYWEDFQKSWAVPVGISMNVVFMIARANTASPRGEDVFGDFHERAGSGWLLWFASFVVHFLSLLSFVNGGYTFFRRRHYRLFEASIDTPPNTSSAHRVRVDSSPISSSAFRFVSNLIAASKAASRAHPDGARDVWELAVWNPTPLCLQLFCFFSPGHVLIYWLFLPVPSTDPRPSITVATAIFVNTLLTAQLSLLQHSFSHQAKDSALIHKEILNEYDTKYVRPALNKAVRDISTQTFSTRDSPSAISEVYSYTPTTYVNRGFQTNPNTNYSAHYDPDGTAKAENQPQRISRSSTTPNLRSSLQNGSMDLSSPLRPTPALAMRQTRFTITPGTNLGGEGGSFGIYSHSRSPLRKPSAAKKLATPSGGRPKSPIKNEMSPLKRSSTPAGLQFDGASALNQRFGQLRGDQNRRESNRY